MGKNSKDDKKARNNEAVKAIKAKQSQKRREQRKLEEIRNVRKKQKQERMQQKGQSKPDEQKSKIKTKREEREEFISSFGKVECYGQRVIAECADQKRKETYLKYVNYEPKLEQDVYYSKKTEGKGEI